jgi:hypothetical protein
MIVVIGRASERPEVGAIAHLPVPEHARPARGATVVRTVCGQSVIGQTFDREDGATCAMCRAISGQHPGGNGRRYLTRWHRSLHPRQPNPEEARHGG